ncbi:hypothetical protein CEUSTIGMA_g11666.t1 [Chlamydomonas eustigma]|uniref:Small ribosomal subunit protein uS3 C-terminal domain-containing protein n=1 Tax=Chlamydomonas eustigma TaxID=1157962 RepID=A0A250XMJ3_9CHLO|nr:hypothetical protein CEUSTIGMA_g11666.t1 [Chlamydomonas eustigma]|eukprot:GAX84243.1 hypothetical protein CEUSTIGMA_g11666.t1 [Chlamydomonas eustigma]
MPTLHMSSILLGLSKTGVVRGTEVTGWGAIVKKAESLLDLTTDILEQSTSTSNTSRIPPGFSTAWTQRRSFAAKGSKKGATAPATPVTKISSTDQVPKNTGRDPRWALAQLRNPSNADPSKLLNPEELEAISTASANRLKEEEADSASDEPGISKASAPISLGKALPLNERDVASLLHQSLSNMAGHNVHFRPFFFSNIFQSAPVLASYVASALEADNSWQRIERLFISSIEGDKIVKGVNVRISGRLGRKAEMATIKEWQYGDHSMDMPFTHVDYGAASAVTRLGVIGVKVWIRYHEDAIAGNYFSNKTGFPMPLTQILSIENSNHSSSPSTASFSTASSSSDQENAGNGSSGSLSEMRRLSFASAWWSKTGPQQPPENRSWEVLPEILGVRALDEDSLKKFYKRASLEVTTFKSRAHLNKVRAAREMEGLPNTHLADDSDKLKEDENVKDKQVDDSTSTGLMVMMRMSQVMVRMSQVMMRMSQVMMRMSQVMVRMSQVMMRMSQVMMRMSQVMMRMSQVMMRMSQVMMRMSQVMVRMSQVMVRMSQVMVRMSQVMVRMSQVMVRMSQVMVRMSQVMMRMSQVMMRMSQVMMRMSQVMMRMSQVMMRMS